MNQRRKYIGFIIKRLSRLVKDVEFYLLVPSEGDELKESLESIVSEIDDIKNQTEDHD